MCLSVISLYKYCIYITIYAYIIEFMLYRVYKIKEFYIDTTANDQRLQFIFLVAFFIFMVEKLLFSIITFFHLYDMQCLMDNCCNDIIPLKLLKMSEKEKKNIYIYEHMVIIYD